MAYAICRVEKVKTSHELNSRFKHNFRIYDVAHANVEMSHLNQIIKELNALNYEVAVKQELLTMQINGRTNYNNRGIRKDAVKGIEVLLSYSYDGKDKIPVDEWVEKSTKWLEETFNPQEHKINITREDGSIRTLESDNVKSIVLHMDEAVPHIHAFVVPIDEKGALNSQRYIGSRQKLQEMQNSYADSVKEFGLKRGTKNMQVEHQDIAKYHTALKEVVSAELPEVNKGETAQEYRDRANVEFQKEKIHHHNDVLKLKQEINEARSERITQAVEHYSEQDKLGKQIIKLAKEMQVDELDERTVKDIRRKVTKVDDFENAIKNYPDKEKADQMLQDFNMMISWQSKHDRKRKNRDDYYEKISDGKRDQM